MAANALPRGTRRGDRLLLAHCAWLDDDGPRATPRERLELLLGGELARLLCRALCGHGRRDAAYRQNGSAR